jgi:segregation and condensation protein B
MTDDRLAENTDPHAADPHAADLETADLETTDLETTDLDAGDVTDASTDVTVEPVPDLPLPMMLEALLLVADEPVTELLLAELTGHPQPDVAAALHALAGDYQGQGRGFELRQAAGGWRVYTRAECAGLVERFVLRGQTARMTQAALETLAVVAYRQPVTRGRVAAVRGVNVDGVMRTLLSRGLIAERGSDPESTATLYGTTDLFLERLGLRDLEELPALAPLLPDLETLEYDQDSIST